MSDVPVRPWPPLITDVKMARTVIWRDRLLTLALWLLLIYFARHALLLAGGSAIRFLGHEIGSPDPQWATWGAWARHYVVVIAALGGWLIVWGRVSVRRFRRGFDLPQPPDLSPAEEAHDAGCSEAELAHWRGLKFAAVDIDAEGRVIVTPRSPESPR